jgi:hypothetical protein
VPSIALLNFGDSTDKVSDWPASKRLRRLALMRSENHGRHAFDGPKQLAFHRMLSRGQQHGRVIVVVVPVAPVYAREFLTPEVNRKFEGALAEAQRAFPTAQFIRLDQASALNADELYGDPVHLNAVGRRIATAELFKQLNLPSGQP